ncbi:PH domain-containing protein [Virgibacillus soli]|uniref:PH domain-containing protein n=1 Tax=Paracerasibacillus soli TaxID=480284 RepID=UPI0035E735BC
MLQINEPNHRIAKEAIAVWRISSVISQVIVLIIGGALIWASYNFHWYAWIPTVLWVLLGIDIVYACWEVTIEPKLKQKYWRYGISEEFVKIKQGIFHKSYTVIPMTKVQYVEAEQGPILRKYKLHAIHIGTMTSSHTIPALPDEEALQLREKIAHLAKLKEVE